LPTTGVVHHIGMGFGIMRPESRHPFFKCFPLGGCVA
jgi:hypothetical protein